MLTPAPLRQAADDAVAREWVLACIDESAYGNSVCDHAGWFASHPEVGVDVLHAIEDVQAGPASGRLAERAVRRLREEGVGPLAFATAHGPFVDLVAETEADIIVMGKRGVASGPARTTLGSNVDAAVRRCSKPICLAPKVFLPIHRALVMLDADLTHCAALEFVVADFRLSALPMDVAVVAKSAQDADAKVEWARRRLSTVAADVFVLPSDGLDSAMGQYSQARSADLVVLSRAVIAPDPQTQLGRIEERGLWSTRAPVLIC